MNANILEIFRSIQGEGKYAGVSQVFVRFFECNMHCAWCDTPHSIGDTTRKFEQVDIEEVWGKVKSLAANCHSVSITGGEPLLQPEAVKNLAHRIKEHNIAVYLETNGVLPDALKQVINGVDTIAMDIKLPSSTKCRAYWQEHKEFLSIAKKKDIFIKTVVTSDTDRKDIEQAVALTASVDKNICFILQPNYFEMQNGVMKRCLEFYDICSRQLSDVRVLPQVHKFMKVR